MRRGAQIPRGLLFIIAAVLAAAADDLCSVEGTIFNSATGEPLRKAVVTFRPVTGGGPAHARAATSDIAGHFAIVGMGAGAYRLIVERSGFTRQEFGAKRPAQAGTAIVLAEGEKRKDIDVRLTPQGVVTGRVLDEDGDPLPMALVSLLRSGYAQGRKQLMPGGHNGSTNDLGEFRLFGLAPGRYYVTASYRPAGFEQTASAEEAYPSTYYPGAISPEGAAPLEIAAGAVLRGIDIRLRKMHAVRIRGRVLDGVTNEPAGGIITMLTPRTEGAVNTAGQTVTKTWARTGIFEMTGVTPGSYVLTAHANHDQQLSARMPLEVGQSDIDDLTLTLTPGAEIAGVVRMEGGTGELPGGIRVQLEPASQSGYPIARVQPDGSFRLQHIQADAYAIHVYGLPDTDYVKVARFGDSDVPNSGLDFSRGVTPGELAITIAPTAAHIDGTVLDDKGQPFAGVKVVIAPEKSGSRMIVTDPSGRFMAGGLAPGNYRMWAFDEIENGAWEDPEYMKPYDNDGERVTLKDNDRQTMQLKLITAANEGG